MGFTYHEWDDVTVIVPAYNAETTIERALKSIEKQSVRAHRIIVVDGGSSDNTCNIAEKVSAVDGWNIPIDVFREEDISLGQARNLGLKKVKTKYVAFLDADDEWHKLKLQKSLEVLKSDSNLAFVAHDVMVIKKNGRKYFQDAYSQYSKSPNKYIGLFLNNYIQTSTVVACVDTLRKKHGFNEHLSHGITQDALLKLVEGTRTSQFKVFKGGYTIYYESHRSLSTKLISTLRAQEYFALAHVRKIAEKSHIPAFLLLFIRIMSMYKEIMNTAKERHLYFQIGVLCLRLPYAMVKMVILYTFNIHTILLGQSSARLVS